MANSKKKLTANIADNTRYGMVTEKINVQFVKRVQDIRKISHRKMWQSEVMNPLIQAKLAQLLS